MKGKQKILVFLLLFFFFFEEKNYYEGWKKKVWHVCGLCAIKAFVKNTQDKQSKLFRKQTEITR